MVAASGKTEASDWPITRRLVGFIDHLRANAFSVGLTETQAAITVLHDLGPVRTATARDTLRALLTGSQDEWQRFDALFEAYWMARGRVRTVTRTRGDVAGQPAKAPAIWRDHLPDGIGGAAESPHAPATGSDDVNARATGRLVASGQTVRARADLRHIADPAEMMAAERTARRLAEAMRYRLSRRTRARIGAPRLDLRRTIRRSIAHGGEPLTLVGRTRPDRPVRIVVFLDVSGSMQPYTRVFLQFVKGLAGQWLETDIYLFHTRLIRVTDALREADPMKAMTRMALMADGFGGGTRLADCLKVFNTGHARRALNSRSVVLVLSDGYDTGSPDQLADQLAILKRRARRLIWLNPMLGWRDYAPVTRAMHVARPFIDHFAAAHSLEALAALEHELAKL